MTITIADGRGALWQWDTGRRVKITDGVGVKQIHYQNRCFGRSVDVDVGADGTAIIPDELLQDWHPLMAYAYVTDDAGGYTKVQVDFAVHKRARPADYVYTPTEHAGFDRLRTEIGDLSALKTDAKENLVAAINEAAESGGSSDAVLYTQQTLTDEQKKQARENISSAGELFVITLTSKTESGKTVYSADKTFDEIKSAYAAGKTPVVSFGNYCYLAAAGDAYFRFTGINAGYEPNVLSQVLINSNNIIFVNTRVLYSYLDNGAYVVGQQTMASAPTADMQIATKKYVDDHAGGGGGETWELIKAITIADDAVESNALTIDTDESGNSFSLKKAKIFGIFPAYKGESTRPNFSFFMLNGVASGGNAPYCYTSGWEIVADNVQKSCSVEVDLTMPGLQAETAWRTNKVSGEYFGPAKIESITSIGGRGMLIYPGCKFWLYGVRS